MSRIFLIKSPEKRSEEEHGALGEDGFFLTIPCAITTIHLRYSSMECQSSTIKFKKIPFT
jgi:hypothetical protein